MKPYFVSVLILIMVSTALIGCGGGGKSENGSTGTVNLYLTDAPAVFEEVNVNITKVSISRSSDPETPEGGWITLSTNPVNVNLLDLRFTEQLLGATTLPAGTYHQLRLLIDSATVKFEHDDTPQTLIIPSAEQTGIKINLRNLTVSANERVNILMDVNVAEFIDNSSGEYKMRSTAIKVAKTSLVGKITGKVTNSETNLPITNFDVVINVKQGTTLITSTLALKEDLNGATAGSFILNNLEPGDYTLEITAPSYGTRIETVTVQAGQTNNIGTYTITQDPI